MRCDIIIFTHLFYLHSSIPIFHSVSLSQNHIIVFYRKQRSFYIKADRSFGVCQYLSKLQIVTKRLLIIFQNYYWKLSVVSYFVSTLFHFIRKLFLIPYFRFCLKRLKKNASRDDTAIDTPAYNTKGFSSSPVFGRIFLDLSQYSQRRKYGQLSSKGNRANCQ